MVPVLFIHGYSAESRDSDINSIRGIYGSLVDDLKTQYAGEVFDIDLSRWVSLDDAVTLNDISRGLDRALRQLYPALLTSGFNVIIHSTGALVIRNWIKLFSPKPSPIFNLVHLAGANLGSGWASIGQGQLAKWGRYVFEGGAQRGVKILQALELGSSPTLDLHLHFLSPGNRMMDDYQVQEYIVIGSHADASWFEFPIPFAKEDGSDGVVRVSAGNLNLNYFSITSSIDPLVLGWPAIQSIAAQAGRREDFASLYRVEQRIRPQLEYPEIPMAVVLNCAHSGPQFGVMAGVQPRQQVLRLLKLAFGTPGRSPAAWAAHVADFHAETEITYNAARNLPKTGLFGSVDPRHQYDPHAQVIFRIRDQDDNVVAVDESDIFFDSDRNAPEEIKIGDLFERTSVSDYSDHCVVFYLRVKKFNEAMNDWEYLLNKVKNFALEITAIDPAASHNDPIVQYLPLRIPLTPAELAQVIQPHCTTIIDVQLTRLPAPSAFQIIPVVIKT